KEASAPGLLSGECQRDTLLPLDPILPLEHQTDAHPPIQAIGKLARGPSVDRLAVIWDDDAGDCTVGRARFDAVVDRLEMDDDDPCVSRLPDTADIAGVHHDRPAGQKSS